MLKLWIFLFNSAISSSKGFKKEGEACCDCILLAISCRGVSTFMDCCWIICRCMTCCCFWMNSIGMGGKLFVNWFMAVVKSETAFVNIVFKASRSCSITCIFSRVCKNSEELNADSRNCFRSCFGWSNRMCTSSGAMVTHQTIVCQWLTICPSLLPTSYGHS